MLKVGDKLRWLKPGPTSGGAFDVLGSEVLVIDVHVNLRMFKCAGPGFNATIRHQSFDIDELGECFEPLAAPTPTINLSLCHCCTRPNEYSAGANYPAGAPNYFRCGECRTLYGAN